MNYYEQEFDKMKIHSKQYLNEEIKKEQSYNIT